MTTVTSALTYFHNRSLSLTPAVNQSAMFVNKLFQPMLLRLQLCSAVCAIYTSTESVSALNNNTLLDFLYVVTEIGGWCCPGCRLSRPNQKPVADNKKAVKKSSISIEQVNDELQFIKTQLASLSDSLTSNPNIAAIHGSSPNPVAQPSTVHPTYAQALKSRNSTQSQPHQPASTTVLDRNLRSAMLTAMHTELHSKSKRSCNVVISGLMPSSLSSDGEQVQELCKYQFDLYPKVRSTLRLGKPVVGKAQPLLVNLESSEDVEDLMAVARDLRHSTNQYVRDHIYINRHLTKAESAAKFNERVLRRQKEKEKAAAVQDTTYDDDMENYEPTTAIRRIHRRSHPPLFFPSSTRRTFRRTPPSPPVNPSRIRQAHLCMHPLLVFLSEVQRMSRRFHPLPVSQS